MERLEIESCGHSGPSEHVPKWFRWKQLMRCKQHLLARDAATVRSVYWLVSGQTKIFLEQCTVNIKIFFTAEKRKGKKYINFLSTRDLTRLNNSVRWVHSAAWWYSWWGICTLVVQSLFSNFWTTRRCVWTGSVNWIARIEWRFAFTTFKHLNEKISPFYCIDYNWGKRESGREK